MRKRPAFDDIFKFGDARINYRVLGAGKSVILLHGSMASRVWEGFDKELAKYFKVYVLELPGFGASDTVKGERHNTDLFAKVLGAFAKNMDLVRVPVLAFSLGTLVALKAAAKGFVLGKLVLVGVPGRVNGGAGFFDVVIPYLLKRSLFSSWWGKRILGVLLLTNVGRAGKRKAGNFLKILEQTDWRSVVEINYKKEIEEDLPKALKKAKNKKLFLYGEYDLLKNTTQEMIRSYEIVPKAGHNAFRGNKKETLAKIRKFL